MEIEVYCNRNFLSCKSYTKVCVDYLDDAHNIRGMFASIYNPDTKKSQAQKYIYDNNHKRNYNANYAGRNPVMIDFPHLLSIYPTFNDDEKQAFDVCMTEIIRAMRAYLKFDTTLTIGEKQFINNKTFKLYNAYFQNRNNVSVEPTAEKTDFVSVTPAVEKTVEIMDWVDVNLDEMNSNEIAEITKQIATFHNPNEGVEFNGKHYRCVQTDNGLALQMKANAVDTVAEKAPIVENVRKTVKMAMMKNADGLTEFVNGNFYPIINKEYFHSVEFVTLITDNGDERKVNAKRITEINVYAEPPINEPETAL